MTEAVVAAADDLSPAEEAFFSSRGEKTEGLAEAPATPDKPAIEEGAKPAADATAKKEPDAKSDPDDTETEETVEVENKGRFVRHGAFHKERMERKKAQEALRNLEQQFGDERTKYARVDERLRLLSEAIQRPAEAEKPAAMPDLEQDPFGYIRALEAKLSAIEGKTTEVAKTTERQTEEQAIASAYRSDAMAFAQQTPDFGDAYKFLLSLRDQQLEIAGVSDPNERARMIHEEEKDLATGALRARQSPSDRIYRLAKSMGYAPKAKEPAPVVEPANNGLKAIEDKIDGIVKAQSATKTLSAGGGSPTDTLTAEALAAMSEDEFRVFLEKTPKSQVRALMGG